MENIKEFKNKAFRANQSSFEEKQTSLDWLPIFSSTRDIVNNPTVYFTRFASTIAATTLQQQTMPLSCSQISLSLINCFQSHTRNPREHVPGRALIAACQEKFCDASTQSEEEYTEERQNIVDAMTTLKQKGVLSVADLPEGGKAFAMGREWVAKRAGTKLHMRREAEEDRIAVQLGSEDLENDPDCADNDKRWSVSSVEDDVHEEASYAKDDAPEADDDVPQEEEEDDVQEEDSSTEQPWSPCSDKSLRSSQQREIDRAEIMREPLSLYSLHRLLKCLNRYIEACAAMIKGAISFIPPPAESSVVTPSRKRRRTMEIAPSNSSSSFGRSEGGRNPHFGGRCTSTHRGVAAPTRK